MRSSQWDDDTKDDQEPTSEEQAAAEAARRRRDVGLTVRQARLARRLPVRRLAHMTGIAPQVIDALEEGRETDVGVAVLVAEAVGLDVAAAVARYARAEAVPQSEADAALPSPLD